MNILPPSVATSSRSRPSSTGPREVRPWLTAAVVVMVATGVPLFLSEAVKCHYSQMFWVKVLT